MRKKQGDTVAERLFGRAPMLKQVGSLPLSAAQLQEKVAFYRKKGMQTPMPGDGTIWCHCRACNSLVSYFWDHQDLYHLNLTHENVVGHYIESAECSSCCLGVGFSKPRLIPVPTAS